MNTQKNVSVVVPTFNSWNTLEECINSVKNQTHEPFEIIVIDNASEDETSKRVKKHFPEVKLVTLQKNTGVTGGRNRGIKEASKNTDYLFFIDHDMVADKRMLKELIRVAEKKRDIGIVTPKIYYWGDKKRIWAAGTGINLWTGQVIFRGGEDEGWYDEVEEVQVAPAAMLVKKEVIEKIKGFDDKYFATYEDTDFCFRAREAGFKTYYSPKALAWHKISPKPEDDADRLLSRAYYVAKNRILFMKEFGNSTFWLFLPLFALYYIKMAILYKRPQAVLDYIRGSLSGITS
jgi:GT2 family glycosyltransferase